MAPLLLLLLAPLGCRVGILDIELVVSPDPAQDPFVLAAGSVEELRVRVEADDLSPIEDTFVVTPGGVASLPLVPVGEGRTITVEGVSDRGFVVLRGRSLPMDIVAGTNAIELYVATVSRFSFPRSGMSDPRFAHAAVSATDGFAYVHGGALDPTRLPDEDVGSVVGSVDRFDPTRGLFTERSDRCIGRAFHTATPVGDAILLVGGETPDVPTDPKVSELFVPANGLCPPQDRGTEEPRAHHAAVSLSPDVALVAGGVDALDVAISRAAKFFCSDESDECFLGVGGLQEARFGFGLAALPNGDLLATGGLSSVTPPVFVEGVELFDAAANTFGNTGNDLPVPVAYHTATALPESVNLPGGGVLLIGGIGPTTSPAEAFSTRSDVILCTGSGTCTELEPLTYARWRHTATLLENGDVLVVGGWSTFGGVQEPSSRVEIVRLVGEGVFSVIDAPSITVARAGHTATLLGNGMVLVAGGVTSDGEVTRGAEVFNP